MFWCCMCARGAVHLFVGERNHEDNWKIMNVEINYENKYSEHSELMSCTN